MKVIALAQNPTLYTCNAYFIMGDFRTIQDVNALVDVGADGYILKEISKLYTGVGKKPVERVVLTHEHFDHCAGLSAVVEKFQPEVYGFSSSSSCPSKPLQDGETIKLGDREFLVIYTPDHSGDSICLYCKKEKALFSGDTPIRINSSDANY